MISPPGITSSLSGTAARRSCAACANAARPASPRSRSSAARPMLRCCADRALVEGVGRARQLDLAVQRLVGDAEQRAVGHAQAVALGRDACRSPCRPRWRATRLMRRRSCDQRSSQLRSSLVTTVPVRSRRFSASPSLAGDPRRRLLQRDLHLGQRRDRHLRRHQRRRGCGRAADSRAPARSRRSSGDWRRPPQWPTISQQCGRSTARWSVMFLAFDGPTPMLTSVTPPCPSARIRW